MTGNAIIIVKVLVTKRKLTKEGMTMKKYPQLLNTGYDSSNGAVIVANVLDFGAKGDGVHDDSDAFMAAMASVADCGGCVYAPAGTYKLTKNMTVPTAIQLLGDFNAPMEENPKAIGTILAIYTKTIAQGGDKYFFTLRMGSGMKGFHIWYPEQTLADGVAQAYPYTVGLADLVVTNLESINFINAYSCVDHFSIVNNQQVCRDIYGTPLRVSVRLAQANDINRYETFNLQPKWWLESGLPGVPEEAALKNWLIHNATGFEMVSMDWHYMFNFTIKGYQTGVELNRAFGRVYGMNITQCNTCLSILYPLWYGTTVTDCVFEADGGENPVAMRIGEEGVWGVSCHSVVFKSTGAHAVENLGKGQLTIQDSRIVLTRGGKAGMYNKEGRFSLIRTEFEGGENHIVSDKTLEPKKTPLSLIGTANASPYGRRRPRLLKLSAAGAKISR